MGPGVLRHCDRLHPDNLVAQRVSRRRQSERYATKQAVAGIMDSVSISVWAMPDDAK
jgi:hypothetical protein